MENTSSYALMNHEDIPIFSCDCHEPNGVITRNVYPMLLSPQNLKEFWEKASQFKMLFWDHIGGDWHKFLQMLISKDGENISANGLFWKIDDMVGIFYMTHIQSFDAQIHYSFFDRRHHGRQLLTRRMIQYVFKEFGFNRLSAEIPCYMNGTFNFIKEVGLKFEGTKREAALNEHGEWYNVNCYGILKKEAESWA